MSYTIHQLNNHNVLIVLSCIMNDTLTVKAIRWVFYTRLHESTQKSTIIITIHQLNIGSHNQLGLTCVKLLGNVYMYHG